MLFNYFKIAFRQLGKNKVISFINIFGLTLGFLCFTLLALYVHDELSYDTFQRDGDRIYRVLQHEHQEDGTERDVAVVAAQLAVHSKSDFPEVEDVMRTYFTGRVTMGNDPLLRNYETTFTADSNFFQFFDFTLLQGNPKTALSKANTLVLTEPAAKKYFGNENALGKMIWVNGQDMEVTGIMKAPPLNSNFDFQIIFPHATWMQNPQRAENVSKDWRSNAYTTFLKMKPGFDQHTFEAKLTELVKGHVDSPKDFKSNYYLQPLTAVHVNDTVIQGNEITNKSSISSFYIYMFVAVGFLILLIACLNYMNLSTAAAYKRTREIGTRKTLGAQKSQLATQFIGEASLISCFALLLAFALLQVTLPLANQFTGKSLQLSDLDVSWMLGIILLTIGTGIVSSLYPAFLVARVTPAEALKKEIKIANRSLPIRKALIVAQFTISIIMLTCTMIIYNQLQFVRTKDLGFAYNDLVVVDINSRNLRMNFETIKAEFNALPEVTSVSVSSRVPGEWKGYWVASVNTAQSKEVSEMIYVGADKDFFNTFSIKFLEGRNFSDALSDSSKVILSELAVKKLGLTDPLGQIIEIPSIRYDAEIAKLDVPLNYEVIGVASDFHFQSLRQEMMPVMIGFWSNPIQSIDYYTLHVNTSNMEKTISKLREINTKFDQNNPLEYTFLDNRFAQYYKTDEQRGQVFLAFSLIIVFISCMGLFAIVSFATESRTKEIGIRKVLGASVNNIITMISKEYLFLVVIAGVLAVPAGYFFMNEWLSDFAYRIALDWKVFALAGGLSVLIAFITMSIKTIKSAVGNPVDSLRSE
jgi:putative ABC transport system permease protein